ncbi:conserved hypothetical protein [uncultured Paludibacter sp.]|nr:conserved hypothetical protein [uncultured Paludibacter sp.]
MLIYNTTYVVENKKINHWKKWIEEIHIPFMRKTGKFTSPQIAKLLFPENTETTSFSVQFKIRDLEMLGIWSELYAEALQNEISKKFGNDVLPFSTVMEVIEQ